jgi:hypothetical protein
MMRLLEKKIKKNREEEFLLTNRIRSSLSKLRKFALVPNPHVSMHDYLDAVLQSIEDKKEENW